MSFLLNKDPLVVVGDAARVRLFSVDPGDGRLVEHDAMVNTTARQNTRDLAADREGRSFDRHGGGRHAMEPSTDTKDHAATVFAKDVAAQLQHAGATRNTIVLIAAPKFLGLLRKQLAPPIKSKVSREINKDLTTATVCEIETLVTSELRRNLPTGLS